jgi:MscS family membrane protein
MLDMELLKKVQYPAWGLFLSLLLYIVFSNFLAKNIILVALLQTMVYMFVALVLVFLIEYTSKYWQINWKKDGREKLVLGIDLFSKVVKGIIFLLLLYYIADIWVVGFNEFLQDFFAILTENKFTRPILIFTIYLVIAQSILYICKTYINEAIRKHEYSWEDLIIEKTEYPLSLTIILYGVKITVLSIGVKNAVFVPVIHSLIVVLVTHMGIAVTDAVIENWERHWVQKTKSRFNEEFIVILHNFVKIIMIVLGVLFILREWGIEIKSLLISLGVMGAILGFALKDSLDNLVGGLSVMLDRSFKTGDLLKLETGETGEVVHVGLRTTRLKTLDNELMIVPNGKLANSQLMNYAKPNNILRLQIPVGVAYGSNVDKVRKVLISCAKNHPDVELPEKIEVRFEKMSDFSLEFTLLFYIRNYRNRFRVANEITTKIYKELDKNGIQIPFPTRTLYMNEGKDSPKRKMARKARAAMKAAAGKKVVKKRLVKKKVGKKKTRSRNRR